MLVEKYLAKQLEELSNEESFHIPNIQGLRELSKINRLVILSTGLICDGPPEVAEIYPTEDQTLNSKHKILLIAASLAQVQKTGKYQALVRATQQEGLALREAEIDEKGEAGVIGKIDRTWYLLGDESLIQSQGFEVGIAVQTLSRKLEQSGMEVLYLAQRNPKRLLGVASVNHRVSLEAKELMKLTQEMGIEVVLLSSIKNAVLKGISARAGIGLIHSELSMLEKKAVASSLMNEQTAIISRANFRKEYQKLGMLVVLGQKEKDLIWAMDYMALVKAAQKAQEIIKTARKKYFWSKI